jgi:hypothetical protein
MSMSATSPGASVSPATAPGQPRPRGGRAGLPADAGHVLAQGERPHVHRLLQAAHPEQLDRPALVELAAQGGERAQPDRVGGAAAGAVALEPARGADELRTRSDGQRGEHRDADDRAAGPGPPPPRGGPRDQQQPEARRRGHHGPPRQQLVGQRRGHREHRQQGHAGGGGGGGAHRGDEHADGQQPERGGDQEPDLRGGLHRGGARVDLLAGALQQCAELAQRRGTRQEAEQAAVGEPDRQQHQQGQQLADHHGRGAQAVQQQPDGDHRHHGHGRLHRPHRALHDRGDRGAGQQHGQPGRGRGGPGQGGGRSVAGGRSARRSGGPDPGRAAFRSTVVVTALLRPSGVGWSSGRGSSDRHPLGGGGDELVPGARGGGGGRDDHAHPERRNAAALA